VSERFMEIFNATAVSIPEQNLFLDGVGHEEQIVSNSKAENTVRNLLEMYRLPAGVIICLEIKYCICNVVYSATTYYN
jgi:hypothetical protein